MSRLSVTSCWRVASTCRTVSSRRSTVVLLATDPRPVCLPSHFCRRLLSKDHRAEPRVGERVPYVIVHGPPGLPLIQLVRQPQDLLNDAELRLNGTYYVTKQVLPPLARIFSLIGVDVFAWYTQLPKTVRVVPPAFYNEQNKKGTISQYFTSLSCPVCEELTNHGMCDKCRSDPQRKAVVLSSRIRKLREGATADITDLCVVYVNGGRLPALCVSGLSSVVSSPPRHWSLQPGSTPGTAQDQAVVITSGQSH
ncbi:hypothetical protein NP493_337g00017 [Ridgeia piscesae]|uniref:DNA-directed DNA polymerase n=1 Tax=Ridgeia piscesae TaxID=27915 RepID=A0AAD9NWA2_RIDPI|nr:hypothetical protein NP493_337g00017 [Ridgeia piscesae]